RARAAEPDAPGHSSRDFFTVALAVELAGATGAGVVLADLGHLLLGRGRRSGGGGRRELRRLAACARGRRGRPPGASTSGPGPAPVAAVRRSPCPGPSVWRGSQRSRTRRPPRPGAFGPR